MKKISIFLLALFLAMTVAMVATAQRQRTTPVFNADTTKPAPGFYGISVKDGQPYLMDSQGIHNRIETSPRFIAAVSYGILETAINVTATQDKYLVICGDSLTINLPSPALVKDDSIVYTISFMGLPKHTTLPTLATVVVDQVCRLDFNFPIHAFDGTTTHLTTTMNSSHSKNFYKIKPNYMFQIYSKNNVWHLRTNLDNIRF